MSISTRTLVATQPFEVTTRYAESAIPAHFEALEDGEQYTWTVIEWPGAEHSIQFADGSSGSVEELAEEVQGW